LLLGNKFEFRAVGSNSNCSNSMTTLNAIAAAAQREVDFD
jgi:glutamine synthetase